MLHPETLPLARAFKTAGVKTWLIGGNAIELLCGGDVRPHDDIDFLILNSDVERATEILQARGFAHIHGSVESGNLFYKRGDLLIDLVPVLEHPPRTLGELASIGWPVNFLDEHFMQGVRTHTPAMHRKMKRLVADYYGVELREKDRIDLAALDAAQQL